MADKHAVNLWVGAEDLLTGMVVSDAAMQFFTGRSTYDFEGDAHGFRFEGCERFPVLQEGGLIPRVNLKELEDLVAG